MLMMRQMCFVFFCQYLDKQSLSYASVAGLIQDLKMDASQYSWCSSIFYVGKDFIRPIGSTLGSQHDDR